jgi:hypothetical protein
LEFEADICIQRMFDGSERHGSVDPYKDLQLYSLNIMATTSLAASFQDANNPIFKKIVHLTQRAMIYAGVTGDLGSFIPKWACLDMVTRKEKEMKDFVSIYRDQVYEKLIENALNGDAECLVKNVYQMMDELNLDEEDILVFMSNTFSIRSFYCDTDHRLYLGDFVAAGTDTVAVSLYWAFAILSHEPDVQAKIIKELDEWKKQYGDHLEFPEYNKHRDSFPYMIAVQKEIMRFRCTTNFGVPHAVTEESKTYNNRDVGYAI